MALPYPAGGTPIVLAVYRAAPAGASRTLVSLLVERGRTVRIDIAANGGLGSILVLSNALADCRPYVGSPDMLRSVAVPDGTQAVDGEGRPAGRLSAFAGVFAASVTRQECELRILPHHDDYDSLRLVLLTGYRYVARDGVPFVPAVSPRPTPVFDYALRLAQDVESPVFDGGASVAHEPATRLLSDADAAVTVRWTDVNLAGTREFALFVLAGVFALGVSMLIEVLKPALLAERRGTEGDAP